MEFIVNDCSASVSRVFPPNGFNDTPSAPHQSPNYAYYDKKISKKIFFSWSLFKKINKIDSRFDVEKIAIENIPFYKEMDEPTLLSELLREDVKYLYVKYL